MEPCEECNKSDYKCPVCQTPICFPCSYKNNGLFTCWSDKCIKATTKHTIHFYYTGKDKYIVNYKLNHKFNIGDTLDINIESRYNKTSGSVCTETSLDKFTSGAQLNEYFMDVKLDNDISILLVICMENDQYRLKRINFGSF